MSEETLQLASVAHSWEKHFAVWSRSHLLRRVDTATELPRDNMLTLTCAFMLGNLVVLTHADHGKPVWFAITHSLRQEPRWPTPSNRRSFMKSVVAPVDS